MSNLNVESLSRIVQSGNIEEMFGGSKSEMLPQNQGLQPSSSQDVAKSFSDILKDSVEKVNTFQTQADTAIKELVAGRNKNIHETMLTVERADTSLKLMMQVRNKVLDAYREVMRMQV